MERIARWSRFGLVMLALVAGMLSAPAARAVGLLGVPGVKTGATVEPGGGWWMAVTGWLARLVGLDGEVPAGEHPGLDPVTDDGERGPTLDPSGIVSGEFEGPDPTDP
jgi:hypothetical protein